MIEFIPKTKDDFNAVDTLYTKSISEVQPFTLKLLEWLQDGNWPIAKKVAEYFRPHIDSIEENIIHIMNSDDDIWKYWILGYVILQSERKIPKKLMEELKRIHLYPTEGEKREGVHELLIELFE